jgi:hypothetical protein
MFKGLIIGAVMAASSFGWAATSIVDVVVDISQQSILGEARTTGLNWKVGDTANYNVDMGGFIKGTMVMTVREIGAEGMWIDQNMDLGFAGKQTVSMLLDPNTGEVKKVLVNGQPHDLPENNMEVVKVEEDKVTVPAGTFECVHATLKDTKTNEQSDMWMNPALVPLSGMIKAIQPSQLGKVTIVLKNFKKI